MQKVHTLRKTAHAVTWNGHNRLKPRQEGLVAREIIPHLPAKSA